ncbi:bifunctional adenosylcobinamide kinase/adenosylcobinamide-phosphate guanylyltransferase [Hasllibacter halocynthiae]|uniref:bifunctional adenosylcobinamide kinase/adenosylcobinamide-phosphate guanylyltransferase n=1 Tax=Hasllibacter halocynthiae TaxID=595589 RepID=UPI003CCBDD38
MSLILGGARSGKSRMAEARAGGGVLIATAQAHDAEMAARIARHRADRGAGWEVLEVPLDLPEALATLREDRPVVIDCLTLWLSNLLLAGRGEGAEALPDALRACRADVICVSNEVGQGIVPATPLGRAFRDAQGRLNQRVAAASDRVTLMVAGLPLEVRP